MRIYQFENDEYQDFASTSNVSDMIPPMICNAFSTNLVEPYLCF